MNGCTKSDALDVISKKNKPKGTIEDTTMTKGSLAAKPVRHVVANSQRYLCIWYDLGQDRLMLKYFGFDAEKLPVVPQEVLICYHKMVDTTTNE